MIAESIGVLLSRRSPVTAFRAMRDSGDVKQTDLTLWAELIEAGFALPQVPASAGGHGMGFMAAGLVAEAVGRNLAATPSHAAAMAAYILQQADRPEALQLLLGGTIFAFAHDEKLRHNPACDSKVVAEGERLRLSGSKRFVAEGGLADWIIVVAMKDGEPCLVQVRSAAAGVHIRPLPLIDHHNAADIAFEDVELGQQDILAVGQSARDAVATALDIGRVLVSAELLGIAQEAFDRTIAYLKEREQFGAKIGSFQALQHRASRLYIALQIARAVVIKALRALDEDANTAGPAASLAKAKLTETARQILNEALQMHGGVGVTDDFDIGLFFKRARALGDWLGDDYFHREWLGRHVWKI
jgi:acyl-CoA dehydrogenase